MEGLRFKRGVCHKNDNNANIEIVIYVKIMNPSGVMWL